MNRRQFVLALPALSLSLPVSQTVFAHHGWSSFDETRPLYFEGKVKSVKWENPHAELVITLADKLAIPADLAKRTPPAQRQSVDGAKILASVALPKARGEWTMEYSPLTRIEAWQVPQPKIGDTVSLVAYTFKDEALYQGKHVARVEYVILGDKLLALRSLPA